MSNQKRARIAGRVSRYVVALSSGARLWAPPGAGMHESAQERDRKCVCRKSPAESASRTALSRLGGLGGAFRGCTLTVLWALGGSLAPL